MQVFQNQYHCGYIKLALGCIVVFERERAGASSICGFTILILSALSERDGIRDDGGRLFLLRHVSNVSDGDQLKN